MEFCACKEFPCDTILSLNYLLVYWILNIFMNISQLQENACNEKHPLFPFE